jgi:hypothetical protein
MKSLTLFIALTFSVMFSSSSYAGWTKVSENLKGTFYVDFERIRKVDGYFYYWILYDYLKPTIDGDFSNKFSNQGDCKLFRYKKLSLTFHKEPMGGGNGEILSNSDYGWRYPPPNSVDETVLKQVCNR